MRNMNLFISFALTVAVVYFGIISGNNLKFFFNVHAVVLVIGGTATVFLMSTPPEKIKSLYKILKYLIFGDMNQNKVKLIRSLHQIAEKRYSSHDVVSLDARAHPFLVDVVSVLNLKNLEPEKIKALLHEKISHTVRGYETDSEILSNLGKYPPAMGLLGATTGIIGMMKNLGQSDKTAIGMYMASALVATIWGIGLSNFVILPLADLIQQLNKEAAANRRMIADAMLMTYQKENPDHVLEFLVSHLPISQQHEVRMMLKTTPIRAVHERAA